MSVSGMGRIETPRRIKPGSELVRTWAGKTHRVTVLEEGYAYAGRTYSSLSEIATSITGTRWNGPRFFGLRSKAMNRTSSAAADSGKDAALLRIGAVAKQPSRTRKKAIRAAREPARSREEIGI
jgi:hypothetical protein